MALANAATTSPWFGSTSEGHVEEAEEDGRANGRGGSVAAQRLRAARTDRAGRSAAGRYRWVAPARRPTGSAGPPTTRRGSAISSSIGTNGRESTGQPRTRRPADSRHCATQPTASHHTTDHEDDADQPTLDLEAPDQHARRRRRARTRPEPRRRHRIGLRMGEAMATGPPGKEGQADHAQPR